MTTRQLFIGFFLIYAILIPVLAWEFVEQNTSAAAAMMGSAIIIALLFWSKRVLFINLIMSFYVFQNYLIRPYISIFEDKLAPKSLQYIESISSYYNPDAATVVYWSLFSLLLAWLIGLLVTKSSQKDNLFFTPRIFTKIDRVVQRRGLAFWLAVGLLTALNYRSPEAGLRAAQIGGGQVSFLFGLASLSTIAFVCLYAFLKIKHDGLWPAQYSLLLLPLMGILGGVLGGGRSALFSYLIVGLIYWLYWNFKIEWKPKKLIKAFLVLLILLPMTMVTGLFAQVLRPLYRYTDSVDFNDILNALNWKSVMGDNEIVLFGITELLYRLSGLKAQFYILNDWYIHEPWQHYNPLVTMMRTVNDLVPGVVFENMLTINQLFDYVYHDTVVFYSSEMWSIQGSLYLYFGHFLAPVVVFLLAVIANGVYPSLKRSFRTSPAFAAFLVLLVLDIITNGTAERVIPVDIIRPLLNLVIFIVLYKAFSLFLPIRIRMIKRLSNGHSPFDTSVHASEQSR